MRKVAGAVGAGLVVSCLVGAGLAPGAQAAPEDAPLLAAPGLQLAPKGALSGTAKPSGPNPFLANLPDVAKVDYAGWARYLETKSAQRALRKARAERTSIRAAAAPILVDEDEPVGIRGSNDTPATAQPVPGFGTRARQNPKARILGTLSPEAVAATAISPSTEDDGSITLARDTGVDELRTGVTTSGTVGDGPYGTTSGDFDVYQVRADAGDEIIVDIDTPTGLLDSFVALYDGAGTLLAVNDDATGLDSLLRYTATTTGDHYAFVTGYRAPAVSTLPTDPFDSASGQGASNRSSGPYNVVISAAQPDVDIYSVQLRKGDVLGASVSGSAGRIAIHEPSGQDVHGSSQDATYIYPTDSPLPGGGNAVTEHVADQDGTHYVAIATGSGTYDVTVEAYRPPLERTGVQTLFLDFDGQRVNTGIWGGPGVRTLSPLRAFLGRWGLSTADESALITAITAEVEENLRADLAATGLNPRFAIRVRNSRDHADTFGQPNVSRIVVGGTIDQSGISTIGIAQSIDPGNFETEESALVLLDLLSDPAGPGYSLNTYLTPASDRLAFVAQAVGNVTAHEAGHFLGDWHVDQFNDVPNLMNQGGANFDQLFGVGPDGVGGTADDIDTDFGEDVFNPNEGFTGIEDTLTRPLFGLS